MDSQDVLDFLDTIESLHEAHFFTEQVQGHKVCGGDTVIGLPSSDPVHSVTIGALIEFYLLTCILYDI